MGQESTQESTLSCAVPDGDDYREIEPPEWAGGTPGESESSRWSISLRWDDQGRAEVRVREGEPPAEIQRLVGTPMSMRALFDAMTPLQEMGDNAW